MDKPQKEIKSEQQLAQAFIEEYQQLCEKHGFQIQVNPAWKARDDGTFSLVQQAGVGKLPKKVDEKQK